MSLKVDLAKEWQQFPKHSGWSQWKKESPPPLGKAWAKFDTVMEELGIFSIKIEIFLLVLINNINKLYCSIKLIDSNKIISNSHDSNA